MVFQFIFNLFTLFFSSNFHSYFLPFPFQVCWKQFPNSIKKKKSRHMWRTVALMQIKSQSEQYINRIPATAAAATVYHHHRCELCVVWKELSTRQSTNHHQPDNTQTNKLTHHRFTCINSVATVHRSFFSLKGKYLSQIQEKILDEFACTRTHTHHTCCKSWLLIITGCVHSILFVIVIDRRYLFSYSTSFNT